MTAKDEFVAQTPEQTVIFTAMQSIDCLRSFYQASMSTLLSDLTRANANVRDQGVTIHKLVEELNSTKGELESLRENYKNVMEANVSRKTVQDVVQNVNANLFKVIDAIEIAIANYPKKAASSVDASFDASVELVNTIRNALNVVRNSNGVRWVKSDDSTDEDVRELLADPSVPIQLESDQRLSKPR